MSYDAPFAGLKVIDLSQGIAGPYCAMMLAQHAAICGGDFTRLLGKYPASLVKIRLNEVLVAARGHKANLLAVRLFRHRQLLCPGQRTHLVLGELPQRE
jgi:hypothetical protein